MAMSLERSINSAPHDYWFDVANKVRAIIFAPISLIASLASLVITGICSSVHKMPLAKRIEEVKLWAVTQKGIPQESPIHLQAPDLARGKTRDSILKNLLIRGLVGPDPLITPQITYGETPIALSPTRTRYNGTKYSPNLVNQLRESFPSRPDFVDPFTEGQLFDTIKNDLKDKLPSNFPEKSAEMMLLRAANCSEMVMELIGNSNMHSKFIKDACGLSVRFGFPLDQEPVFAPTGLIGNKKISFHNENDKVVMKVTSKQHLAFKLPHNKVLKIDYDLLVSFTYGISQESDKPNLVIEDCQSHILYE
jgi:hypothetical protein